MDAESTWASESLGRAGYFGVTGGGGVAVSAMDDRASPKMCFFGKNVTMTESEHRFVAQVWAKEHRVMSGSLGFLWQMEALGCHSLLHTTHPGRLGRVCFGMMG